MEGEEGSLLNWTLQQPQLYQLHQMRHLHPMQHWQPQQPRQQQQDQHFMFSPMFASHTTLPQPKESSRIPMVDPSNGGVIALPDAQRTLGGWQHQVSVF
jgi:hypothetical protein